MCFFQDAWKLFYTDSYFRFPFFSSGIGYKLTILQFFNFLFLQFSPNSQILVHIVIASQIISGIPFRAWNESHHIESFENTYFFCIQTDVFASVSDNMLAGWVLEKILSRQKNFSPLYAEEYIFLLLSSTKASDFLKCDTRGLPDSENYRKQHLVVNLREQLKFLSREAKVWYWNNWVKETLLLILVEIHHHEGEGRWIAILYEGRMINSHLFSLRSLRSYWHWDFQEAVQKSGRSDVNLWILWFLGLKSYSIPT